MAPKISEPAKSGTKRKLNLFAIDQSELIHFGFDGTRFTIHTALFHECCGDDWQLFRNHFLDSQDHDGRHFCGSCPHSIPQVSSWAFRGFVYWIYNRNLPSNEMLKAKSIPCPAKYQIGKEQKPLACSMAIELHFLASELQYYELENATMAYLFQAYTAENSVPCVKRLQQIFSFAVDVELSLQTFCFDLFRKRKPALTSILSGESEPASDIPQGFPLGLCKDFNTQTEAEDSPLELEKYLSRKVTLEDIVGELSTP